MRIAVVVAIAIGLNGCLGCAWFGGGCASICGCTKDSDCGEKQICAPDSSTCVAVGEGEGEGEGEGGAQ